MMRMNTLARDLAVMYIRLLIIMYSMYMPHISVEAIEAKLI